jgi:DNA-binding beta-propeller fold protein YncE
MKLLTLFTLLGIAGSAFAQQPATFASGLLNPNKIILGPAGTLLSAEAGSDKNSGRVSVISAAGARRTLIDGLPSGLSAPGNEPDGVNGLLLDGNTLYIAIGEGDLFANGTAPGTTIIAPRVPASPIFGSVLQVVFTKSVDQIATGFTLRGNQHIPLLDGNSVVLDNGQGDTATVTLLAQFRPRPDPVAIYKNCHPFGLAKIPGDPNHIYMNDAGLNLVTQIEIPSGRARTVSSFGPFPNVGSTPPPVVDAVPTSVRTYGNQLLVTFLTGFPFTPGDARVLLLDPATGKSDPFISWTNSTMDIAWRPRGAGERPQFWTLEYSTNQLAGAAGRVLRFDTPVGVEVATGLSSPTSLALDEANGKLYISTRSDGKILVLDVGK